MFVRLDERGYPIYFSKDNCNDCISVSGDVYVKLTNGKYAYYNNELIEITNKYFDYNTKKWVDLPREIIQQQLNNKLYDKKQNLIKQLKQVFKDYRDNKATIQSRIINKEINARQQDLINIDSLIALLKNDTDTIQFRCADNSFVEVSKIQLKKIKEEIVKYGMQIYQNKWKIEKQINNLTVDDIDNDYDINITKGELIEK